MFGWTIVDCAISSLPPHTGITATNGSSLDLRDVLAHAHRVPRQPHHTPREPAAEQPVFGEPALVLPVRRVRRPRPLGFGAAGPCDVRTCLARARRRPVALRAGRTAA